jgi:prepilin-type N-terminal cleavage/methylation domain-containing protein
MHRRAFTLLEVVLVLTILVIVTVLAYPSLEGMYDNARLKAAADEVRAAWTEARTRAVNEGRPYRFALVPGKGNYRLAPDASEFWSGDGTQREDTTEETERPLVLEKHLARGVRFNTEDGTMPLESDTGNESFLPPGSVELNKYLPILTFFPDGTSREDVSIVFSLKGARPILLRLRGITGAVTVRPLESNAEAKP